MKFKILIRYAVDLISAIADHLKFNFTFKWVDDGNYGSKKEDSNEWNGMIGELKSGVRKLFLLTYLIFWIFWDILYFWMVFCHPMSISSWDI